MVSIGEDTCQFVYFLKNVFVFSMGLHTQGLWLRVIF